MPSRWTKPAVRSARHCGSGYQSIETLQIFDKFGSPEVMEMWEVVGLIKAFLI